MPRRLPECCRFRAQIGDLALRLALVGQDGEVTDEGAAVAATLRAYHDTLLSMHEVRIEKGGQPRTWNELVDRLQRLHLQLRDSPEGRNGITAFITDENLTVRQWAAGHALGWYPELARAELERQASDKESLTGFEAEITLREFDNGRLNMTWEPKSR